MLLALLLALPAAAQEPALLGRWGNAAQCAGALIVEGGSVAHAPVTISAEWFEQRGTWCRLTWFPAQRRNGGLLATTRALCGEDSQRSYWLALDLDTSGVEPEPSLIWEQQLVNGPMRRCE